MRIVIAFLAALVAALGTGYYVYEEMRNAPVETAQAVEAPPLKEVFVPAAELSAGSIIKPEHLGRMPVDDLIAPGAKYGYQVAQFRGLIEDLARR